MHISKLLDLGRTNADDSSIMTLQLISSSNIILKESGARGRVNHNHLLLSYHRNILLWQLILVLQVFDTKSLCITLILIL